MHALPRATPGGFRGGSSRRGHRLRAAVSSKLRRKRGAAVYQTYCASCHGAGGRGGEKAGSIVDGSFLALVSNQSLRTMVIVGRPDLGVPDFRGNLPGRAMSSDEVSDVVAWLSAQRTQVAGRPYPAAAQAGNEGGGQ